MTEPTKKTFKSLFLQQRDLIYQQSLPQLLAGALILLVILLPVVVVTVIVWDYTNSPGFCGTRCHTMPPEYAAYKASLHSQVRCVDCHIGKASTLETIRMKASHGSHLYRLIFGYERPIIVKSLRPAKGSCERCHWPEAFHDDTVREIKHYASDINNTESKVFLVMRTGGGATREGRGKGIHWHIENEIFFIANDKQKQNIPWVKVVDFKGNVTEYIDATAEITPEFIKKTKKHKMDCLDCHNRSAHLLRSPDRALDKTLALRRIDRRIPFIKKKGLEVLRVPYTTIEEGVKAIWALEDFYRKNYADFYNQNHGLVQVALQEFERILRETVFPDMAVGWTTYPDNIGHKEFAGCFRCHNGKHFNSKGESIRLHCNICHSIPLTVAEGEWVDPAKLGEVLLTATEPPSHKGANFMADHRFQAEPNTCGACHGSVTFGYKNHNFCSNEACHGTKWPMVNLDAKVSHPIERIGKHAQVWCHECHKGERKPEYVCSNCHKPPKKTHYGPDCSQCHSPVGWKKSAAFLSKKKPPPLPHELKNRENCLVCHGEDKFKPFPAEHKGRTNETCLTCHKSK